MVWWFPIWVCSWFPSCSHPRPGCRSKSGFLRALDVRDVEFESTVVGFQSSKVAPNWLRKRSFRLPDFPSIESRITIWLEVSISCLWNLPDHGSALILVEFVAGKGRIAQHNTYDSLWLWQIRTAIQILCRDTLRRCLLGHFQCPPVAEFSHRVLGVLWCESCRTVWRGLARDLGPKWSNSWCTDDHSALSCFVWKRIWFFQRSIVEKQHSDTCGEHTHTHIRDNHGDGKVEHKQVLCVQMTCAKKTPEHFTRVCCVWLYI